MKLGMEDFPPGVQDMGIAACTWHVCVDKQINRYIDIYNSTVYIIVLNIIGYI